MKKRFCINCGKQIPQNTNFCPYCGAKQSQQTNPNSKTATNNKQSESKQQQNVHSQPNQTTTSNNLKTTAQNKMNGLFNMKQDTEKEEADNARKEESLSLQERNYISNEVANRAPSVGVTYLLGIFLFEFGAPQWYLHHDVAGVLILINSFVLVWIFGLGALINFIWWIVDLFLYPSYIRHIKASIKHQAITEVSLMRKE